MSNRPMVAPFISEEEYLCGCCKKYPVDFYTEGDEPEIGAPYLMLFKYFYKIREAWSKPIPINSGYRCPKHNKAERGHPYSIHLFGLALDLRCKDEEELGKMALLIKQVAPDLRIGIYRKLGIFIHVDVGYYIYPRVDKKWRKGGRWYG